MKQCATCKEFKDEAEFNWRNKLLRKRWGTCRECQRKQQKRWYKNNKETHIANVYENRVNKMNEGRDYIWDYLSTHPCVECGEDDPRVLEFHHLKRKGTKRAAVTRLVRDGYSIDVIQKEINKCIVLYANCHKRRTYKGTWRDQ